MQKPFGENGVTVLKPREWKETAFGGYTTAMVIRCYCGSELHLVSSNTECDCGRTFNKYGQQLESRARYRNEE